MLNPKIIYLLVAVVFIYIVAKFKLMPYLAARKILKDSKKNGKALPDATGNVQQSGMPALSQQTMQAMQSAFPIGMLTSAPASSASGKYRDMYFDCDIFDIHPEDYDDNNDALAIANCDAVVVRVNDFLLCLRKRGIYPDTLGIIPIADRLFMIYVTYTS